MSGPKAADVRPKLQNAIASARKQIDAAVKNASRLREIGDGILAASEKSADAVLSSVSNAAPSDAMLKYAREESTELASQKTQIENCIAQGKRESALANQMKREAETLHQRSQALLEEVIQTTQIVADRLKTNWYLNLYTEDDMARDARNKAKEALQLENEVSEKLRAALSHGKRARDAFDSAVSASSKFLRNAASIRKMASERETTERIAEANQREATASSHDIPALTASIRALNHEKFSPGTLAALQPEIQVFTDAFSRQDYALASRQGKAVAAKLKELETKVTSAQNAFETAEISARNSLDSARQEIAPLNKDELIRWTGKKEEVNQAFAAFHSAEERIAAEDFTGAENEIASGLSVLREMSKVAETRKNNAEQRSYIAEVIMNALYEQGYDAPSFYYEQQNPDGTDVEFSNLMIFAKSPGNQGDMRMNIDLEGKVKLEVEGIAEGKETVCHQIIQNLQKGMAGEIDFQMTDWGRAAHVDPDAKVEFKQQEKMQEKTRERQNE